MSASDPLDDTSDASSPEAIPPPGASDTDDDSARPSPPVATAPVTFTGQGGEYFRIWIVNVALTILTLGIFSAWAKVRRLQYFHRHTRLAGASFDYHGDPVAILKGRLIGGVMFGLYTAAGYMSPLFALATIAAIGCVMPWMLARSLRFRLRNTSYRGLRFSFSGSTREAYRVFLLLPIATVLSFGLLGPLWHHRIKRYQHNHAAFGSVPFGTTPATQDFYVTYVFAGMIGAVAVGAFAALVTGMVAAMGVSEAAGDTAGPSETAALVVLAAGFGIYVLGLLTLQAFLTARLRNTVWNATSAGGFTFTSSLKTAPLLWITITNLVATIATVGLFWPFAQVRLTRYLAQGISMRGVMDFGAVSATDAADEAAIGEEVAGLFDFDIAF